MTKEVVQICRKLKKDSMLLVDESSCAVFGFKSCCCWKNNALGHSDAIKARRGGSKIIRTQKRQKDSKNRG
jgi:hypothetical protein